jgi:hypothetical protein
MLIRYPLVVAFALLAIRPSLHAQEAAENNAIIKVVRRLFEGMEKGDSAIVRSVFAKEVTLATMRRNKDNIGVLSRENSIDGFLKAVGTPHPEIWYEEIWNIKVQLDDNFAQVWCDYAFYVGNKFSHCGVDAFHLYKGDDGWKIIHLADTRRINPCTVPPEIGAKHRP